MVTTMEWVHKNNKGLGMENVKVVKSEFEEWAKKNGVLYASSYKTKGQFIKTLRFFAYVDGGGYKVTLGSKTIYEGGSFSTAAHIFNSEQGD